MAMSKAVAIAAVTLSAWSASGLRKKSSKSEVMGSYFTDEAGKRRSGGSDTSFGVAMADVDGDGDLDVFVSNSEETNRLYINTDGKGTFEDMTDGSGLAVSKAATRGVAFADVNDDGKLDLFMTAYGSANLLFLGDGTGRFEDVSFSAGLADMGAGQGACFADVDGDGDLDLFVANFGDSDKLYLNDGSGVFRDVTVSAGVQSDGVNGFGCVFADFDEDGDVDLYVNNDGALNKLYINDGNGVFTDKTVESGAGATDGGGRAVQAADFNGDGHVDLYAVVAQGSNTYLLGNGDGTFTDATAGSGLDSQSGIAQGMNVADVDGDGDLDILVTVMNNGHALYRNDGAGNFKDVTFRNGAGFNKFGQGLAFGDLNGDGKLDGYLASWGRYFPICPLCSSANSQLMNKQRVQSWLKVRPVSGKGAPMIGAEVTVYEAGSTTKRAAVSARIDGGSGFCSQNAPEAYFGLGSSSASRFDVWTRCRGAWQTAKDVAPNQVLTVQC